MNRLRSIAALSRGQPRTGLTGVTCGLKRLALIALLFGAWSGRPAFALEDTDGFIAHFHDDANIPDYVAAVDGVIDAGERKIYPSTEAEGKDKQIPEAKTKNGILMLYTLTRSKDGVVIHFSTSRAPYLPVPLGKHIVGLFMVRSGWPKPAYFSISKNQVFHAIWVIPDSDFAQIQKVLPSMRTEIRKKGVNAAFLNAVLRSAELNADSGPKSEATAPASRNSP